MDHIPTPTQLQYTQARYAEMKRRGWFTPGTDHTHHNLTPEQHAKAHAFAHHIHMEGWVSDPDYLEHYDFHPEPENEDDADDGASGEHTETEPPNPSVSASSSWEKLLQQPKSKTHWTPKKHTRPGRATDSWHRLVLDSDDTRHAHKK